MASPFNTILARLTGRRDTIRQWIMSEAGQIYCEQAHLDEGCAEQAYWNHGYQAALDDVIQLLNSASPAARTVDSTTS